jgi:hypothetical protein
VQPDGNEFEGNRTVELRKLPSDKKRFLLMLKRFLDRKSLMLASQTSNTASSSLRRSCVWPFKSVPTCSILFCTETGARSELGSHIGLFRSQYVFIFEKESSFI